MTSSAKSSVPLATAADAKPPDSAATKLNTNAKDLRAACMATAIELEATRQFVKELDAEREALQRRLITESDADLVEGELIKAQKAEIDSLRLALDAKDRSLKAKDTLIAEQDKLIGSLERKRSTPLKRLRDILIGAAAALIFK